MEKADQKKEYEEWKSESKDEYLYWEFMSQLASLPPNFLELMKEKNEPVR